MLDLVIIFCIAGTLITLFLIFVIQVLQAYPGLLAWKCIYKDPVELDQSEVLEFQYELVPKAKKVSMIQQFFADIETAVAPPSPILVHEYGECTVDKKRERRRIHTIEEGLAAAAAVTTAVMEPIQGGTMATADSNDNVVVANEMADKMATKQKYCNGEVTVIKESHVRQC